MMHEKTPYEVWNCRKPNIRHLRRYGCVVYLLDKEEWRKKFDPKTVKGIFVGYATNNTYWIYVPKTARIKTDCDVRSENRNGYGMLIDRESKDPVNNENLKLYDWKKIRIQEKIEECEEDGRTESGNNEYEDAEIEELEQGNEIQNENERTS